MPPEMWRMWCWEWKSKMAPIGVTVLASGSSGNCIIVHCGDDALMIDCGISKARIRSALAAAQIDESAIKGVLITHEHQDHVSSLPAVGRHFNVPVYATRLCAETLRGRKNMPPMTMINTCHQFPLGGFNVLAFPVPHDAVDPVGYVITRDSCRVGIATDFGATNAMTDFQLRDCSTLVVESNYDLNMLAASARPWRLKQRILGPIGHLSNPDNAALLSRVVTSNTKNVILGHISHDCNNYDIAYNSAKGMLNGLNRPDITLACARREEQIPTVWN